MGNSSWVECSPVLRGEYTDAAQLNDFYGFFKTDQSQKI